MSRKGMPVDIGLRLENVSGVEVLIGLVARLWKPSATHALFLPIQRSLCIEGRATFIIPTNESFCFHKSGYVMVDGFMLANQVPLSRLLTSRF